MKAIFGCSFSTKIKTKPQLNSNMNILLRFHKLINFIAIKL